MDELASKKFERLNKILSRIKYKGWSFSANASFQGSVYLRANMHVQDRNDPYRYLEIGNPKEFPVTILDSSEREIVHICMDLIIQSEIHEAYEHFKYGGNRLFDPHYIPAHVTNQFPAIHANLEIPHHGRMEYLPEVFEEPESREAATKDVFKLDISQRSQRSMATNEGYRKGFTITQPTPRYR